LNKRIPTLLGLFIITIGVIITSILVKTGVITVQYAAPSETPENVRITNVTANSFTVSYTTQTKVLGSLAYGTTSDYGNVGYDDRDQKTTTAGEYTLHYMTIKNLKPSTLYFFAITSGKDSYLHNDTPFQVTTGPILSQDPPTQKPVTGKILLPDGTIPTEAAIYLSTDGSQTISAFIQPDGSYILPLNSLRTQDLTAYATISQNQKLRELVIDATQKSSILLLASQINPIPAVTLSQDYDFTAQTTPLASPSAQTSFPSFTTTLAPKSKPQILTPKSEQGFTDTQPMFKGTAQPGENVQITVHSEQVIKSTVTTDKNGNWSFRPDQNLAPGEHTITIVTRNTSGILQTIQKSFTVYAAGTQVSQSATPSATVTPKPTIKPTAIPTAVPTSQPTPIPTAAPTIAPTVVAAVTIQPTPTIAPKTKGDQPLTPGSESTTVLGIAAVITTSLGVLLFLFTKRSTSL
jgi:hypothetical protein